MKFKIQKTSNEMFINVTTELTKEMLTRVPESSRQLKDKDGKVVFTVAHSNTPSVKSYGLSVPGKTCLINVTEQKEQDVKYLLAEVLPNAVAVEKQVKDKYAAMNKAADEIEVEGE